LVTGTRRAFGAVAAHNRMVLTGADTVMVRAAFAACVDANLINADATSPDAECSALYLVAVG